MKFVVLYGAKQELEGFFDTVKEAEEYAEDTEMAEAYIFTMFASGIRSKMKWEVNASTAANLTENKKAKEKEKKPKTGEERKGVWTQKELEAALDAYQKGKSISYIAEQLKRSYNAVYSKLSSIGAIK